MGFRAGSATCLELQAREFQVGSFPPKSFIELLSSIYSSYTSLH